MAEQVLLKGIRLFEKKATQPDFVLATGVITPKRKPRTAYRVQRAKTSAHPAPEK